jgi:hypothetical protein
MNTSFLNEQLQVRVSHREKGFLENWNDFWFCYWISFSFRHITTVASDLLTHFLLKLYLFKMQISNSILFQSVGPWFRFMALFLTITVSSVQFRENFIVTGSQILNGPKNEIVPLKELKDHLYIIKQNSYTLPSRPLVGRLVLLDMSIPYHVINALSFSFTSYHASA